MPALKKISVQICSYNRKHLLRESLRHLFNQTVPPELYEIIVVDDGSTDGTADLVETLRPPADLFFIRQEKEGLAAGRNKGVQKARGELVLFIDDDVLADSRLLEEHVRFHGRYPKSVVKGWVNHVSALAKPDKPVWTIRDYSRAFFWTSNVSVEKRYLLEAGLFDERFKEYGWEDLELGLRLRALGLKSRINRKAMGYHYKKKLSAADVPSALAQAEAKGRSAVVFVRKNQGWRSRLSTGIHPAAFFLSGILSWNPFLKFIEERAFRPGTSGSLSFVLRWCVRFLALARYYKGVREGLKQ